MNDNYKSNGICLRSFAARIGSISAPYILGLTFSATWLPNTSFSILGWYYCFTMRFVYLMKLFISNIFMWFNY